MLSSSNRRASRSLERSSEPYPCLGEHAQRRAGAGGWATESTVGVGASAVARDAGELILLVKEQCFDRYSAGEDTRHQAFELHSGIIFLKTNAGIIRIVVAAHQAMPHGSLDCPPPKAGRGRLGRASARD